MVDVFVSHAGRDRPWAEWVAWQLERNGLSVELDYWDWKAGENFVVRMSEALRSCKAMVALFSEAYVEPTRWSTQEWTAALVLAKEDPTRFVPVRIEDAPVPEILGPILAPALFGLSASDARAELLRAVQGPTRPGLAIGLRKLGQVEASRELNEDTLGRRRRVLGPDHPHTLDTANNLAVGLRELGEHAEARRLQEWVRSQRRM